MITKLIHLSNETFQHLTFLNPWLIGSFNIEDKDVENTHRDFSV